MARPRTDFRQRNNALLEEGRRPSEAPATCPTRDPEQGWDRPRVLTLNRPSRTQSCLSRLLATRILATDRPQLRFVLPIGVTGGTQLARARAWRPNPESTPPPGSLEPAAKVRWRWMDASARSRTRWPIEFLYPTGLLPAAGTSVPFLWNSVTSL
jgi:hypothetical protein